MLSKYVYIYKSSAIGLVCVTQEKYAKTSGQFTTPAEFHESCVETIGLNIVGFSAGVATEGEIAENSACSRAGEQTA